MRSASAPHLGFTVVLVSFTGGLGARGLSPPQEPASSHVSLSSFPDVLASSANNAACETSTKKMRVKANPPRSFLSPADRWLHGVSGVSGPGSARVRAPERRLSRAFPLPVSADDSASSERVCEVRGAGGGCNRCNVTHTFKNEIESGQVTEVQVALVWGCHRCRSRSQAVRRVLYRKSRLAVKGRN